MLLDNRIFMLDTLLLAQFFGLFIIILALSMLVRRKMVLHILDDLLKNRSLLYFVGVFEAAAGLLIVLYHNVWVGTVATVITVLGWLILIEGVFYLFASQKTLKKMAKALHNSSLLTILGFIYLALGAILVIAGFSA